MRKVDIASLRRKLAEAENIDEAFGRKKRAMKELMERFQADLATHCRDQSLTMHMSFFDTEAARPKFIALVSLVTDPNKIGLSKTVQTMKYVDSYTWVSINNPPNTDRSVQTSGMPTKEFVESSDTDLSTWRTRMERDHLHEENNPMGFSFRDRNAKTGTIFGLDYKRVGGSRQALFKNDVQVTQPYGQIWKLDEHGFIVGTSAASNYLMYVDIDDPALKVIGWPISFGGIKKDHGSIMVFAGGDSSNSANWTYADVDEDGNMYVNKWFVENKIGTMRNWTLAPGGRTMFISSIPAIEIERRREGN